MIGNDLVATQSPASTLSQKMQQQSGLSDVSPAANATGPAAPPQACDACQKIILDRFICFVLSRPYHPRCLACSDCGSQLVDRCFAKSGRLYCRGDFLKRFGARCAACSQAIAPNELVRRARNRVYHLSCFACCMCHRPLATGDELYMADENRFLCRTDFLSSVGGSGGPGANLSAVPSDGHPDVNGNDGLGVCPPRKIVAHNQQPVVDANGNIISGLENGAVMPCEFGSPTGPPPPGYMLPNPEMGVDAMMPIPGGMHPQRLHHAGNGDAINLPFAPVGEGLPDDQKPPPPPPPQSTGGRSNSRRATSKQKPSGLALSNNNTNNPDSSGNTADWKSNSSEQSSGPTGKVGKSQSNKSSKEENSIRPNLGSSDLGDTLDGDNNNDVAAFSDDESLPSSELLEEDLIDSEGESIDGDGSPSRRKARNRNKQSLDDSNNAEGGLARQSSSASGSGTPGATTTGKDGKRRGPRTTIKAKQLEMLKSAFAATPKPTRHIREQLAAETGLNMRVIQVWFQNRRSKERRMKQLSAMGARRVFLRNQRRSRPFPATTEPSEMIQHQPGVGPGGPLAYYPDGAPPDFYAAAAAYHQQHGGPPPGAVDPSMYYNQQPGVVIGEPVGPGFGMVGGPGSAGPPGLASPPLSQPSGDFDHASMHHGQTGFMLPLPGQEDMMFAS